MSKLYGRTRARCQAVELLYQAEVSGANALDLVQRHTYLLTKGPLHEYTQTLLHDYYQHQVEIDEVIQAHLTGWDMTRLFAVDRSLLRVSVAEMLAKRADTSVNVIIDEAVEIAKAYGQDGSPRFVNGVLGSVAKQLYPNLTAQDLPQAPKQSSTPHTPVMITKDDTIVWPQTDDQAFEVWERDKDE